MIEELQGNRDYVIKVCAGTKSLSNPDDQPLLGQPSVERAIYLPQEKCRRIARFNAEDYFDGELSAGMIIGAVCALLFLLVAVIGFVIWR